MRRAIAAAVQVLVAASVDSWAPLRASVLATLRALPKPLPGLETAPDVEGLARWALGLLRSPRPFEAAAASQLLSLLHDGYVLRLGWRIAVHPDAAVSGPAAGGGAGGQGDLQEVTVEEARRAGVVAPAAVRASVACLASVVAGIEAAVAVADGDMAAACRESFLQGKLLLLQALLSAFPWAAALPLGPEVRCVLCMLRDLSARRSPGHVAPVRGALFCSRARCTPRQPYELSAWSSGSGSVGLRVSAPLDADACRAGGRGVPLAPHADAGGALPGRRSLCAVPGRAVQRRRNGRV